MLGSIVKIRVDEKLVPDDRFDDLTTVDEAGRRERTQVKHRDNADQPLTLATFTSDARSLRLDRVIKVALADRGGPGNQASELSFRIVLRDTPPTDRRLLAVLGPANPDPGPFLPGMESARMRFRADALWEESRSFAAEPKDDRHPFVFLQVGEEAIQRPDLDWICERLVVELAAPAASFDLTNPGAAEQLLLHRVHNEVGAGLYPNTDRSDVDVAEALIRSARTARQGSMTVTASELLRRARLRIDFGAVARAHPVDSAIEVQRQKTVDKVVRQAAKGADEGKVILLVGPPGQGKSWICQQMINSLSDKEWLVAEHYCYLGDADGELLPRVQAESVFGSLLGRLSENDLELVSEQRPRFAANEQALEDAVVVARQKRPDRRVALVVDGIDHVTRVIAGGPNVDPSFTLAEALAALALPAGSTLIVLSQPGTHLVPLEAAGAVKLSIPRLTIGELRELATQLGVLGSLSGDSALPGCPPLLSDTEATEEFVATLSDRSAGNALYATYLCREALRNPTTGAGPAAIVGSLPQFDESLRSYYLHIQASLGDQGAWVADVIALLDFPVSRSELKAIRPDMAHRVDQAVDVLRPVLIERATQAGIRIYHESFARFLRLQFQDHAGARMALLDRIIEWLEGRGMFKDSRAFRHLLPILSEANYNQKVVEAVGCDFVVRSIAAGFPASAIIENLATAIGSAASVGNWPAVVRYVEMSRSAETYQEERFESAIVGFVDVIGCLLGLDRVSERLLHDGRPVMSARSGLLMCAALDALGAVAPWREYMRAFLRESKDDNTVYGQDSDREVRVAQLRGRLRLSSFFKHDTSFDSSHKLAQSDTDEDDYRGLYAPVNWARLAKLLDESDLPASDVVRAILDTYGLQTVVDLIGKLSHPGAVCLALAEEIAAGKAPDSHGDAFHWASRADACGVPPGSTARLFAIGVEVDKLDLQPIPKARERLLELTREVREPSVYLETGRYGEWIDLCTVAARNDRIGLSAAEALLEGPGWYTCWLRFTIALVVAEAASADQQSRSGLEALRILTEVQDPYLGKPRACDLYTIHSWIEETIRRAVSLLDDHAWEEALEILGRVSAAVSTTVQGEISGPVRRDRLLHLAVDTVTPTRRTAAQTLVNYEIENGGEGRYYSDLAEYRLVAARLALTADDSTEARRHWNDACRLLIAYGWHKDLTIYELLDPLPSMIAEDPLRGRVAVAKLQPLCERIPQHTDGKDTRYAVSRWWQLLAAADPCALWQLIQPRLLSSCNDPNWLLHGARYDLWCEWHHRTDPIVAGALQLTLEETLNENTSAALGRLADICDGTGNDQPSRLMIALMARIDERPFKYSYSNGNELLVRDRERVDELNAIAARAGVLRIAPLPTTPVESGDDTTSSNLHRGVRSVAHLPNRVDMVFQSGAVGVAQAIRAWRSRQYGETDPDLSVQRLSNILGYRIIELVQLGREGDAETALSLIADAERPDSGPKLLKELAEGFERHGHSSLAALAYALTWTQARDRGWMTFGGETEIESLQRATRLDRAVALRTIARKVHQVASRGFGTLGIARALVYGFTKGGLGTTSSVAFDIWDEAFAVIAERVPRVAAADDPDDVYVAPTPDCGADLPGDIETAFAAATVAGLAHPGREQKRRSLVAIQVLINERASAVAAVLGPALSSLSDPATLTWLLRVIELEGEKASPILIESRSAFTELTGRPHLTVRALARRLLSSAEVPLVPSAAPDSELLEHGSTGLLLPAGVTVESEHALPIDGIIDEVAGVRLSRVEPILPGFRKAVRKRVDTLLNSEAHKRRRQAQIHAYQDTRNELLPDAFLVWDEAVEDAIQRVAAGARAACLMNHGPVADSVELEETLAQALLNEPELPLALERTRQSRPEIPPPPPRSDPLWDALRVRAEGGSVDETGVEDASQNGSELLGTVAIMGSEDVLTIVGGPYDGWRLVAAVEQRVMSRPDWGTKENDIIYRYRVVELRLSGDRHALTLPPIAKGDLRAWSSSSWMGLSVNEKIRSQPVIGSDLGARAAGEGYYGLGVQGQLLTPTPWLVAALSLKRSTNFVLHDEAGPALALITWRTEYEISDYHLAWPRLRGAGMVVRREAFDSLVHAAQGGLISRDFLAGSLSLSD